MSGFSRDCLAGAGVRCRTCGSPRAARHAEIATLSIAHTDFDAFYATVEKHDRPLPCDQPVIVSGGTLCARTFDIRSAAPLFQAPHLCPHTVIIPSDMDKYVRTSREGRQLMQELMSVEPLSIDEAFLDLGGTARLHALCAAKSFVRFAARVETAIGITASIGLSCNKFLGNIASDHDKPCGC
jgi:DNA polymerase IV